MYVHHTDVLRLLKAVAGGTLPLLSLPANAAGKLQMETGSPVGMAGDAIGTDFLVQFTVGLGVVLLSVVGLAWLMRRFSRLQSSANGSLQVVGGLALGTRERVVLVQVGDTQVLLGVAPGQVQAVHVLDKPIHMDSVQGERGGQFAARLREALKMEKVT